MRLLPANEETRGLRVVSEPARSCLNSFHYIDEGELPLVAAPGGHGVVGFCGEFCGGALPGDVGVVEFGGAVVDPGVPGVVPGLLGAGLPVELPGGIVPGAGTHGPFPGTGAGVGVTGGALPGVPGWGAVCGVLGLGWACGVVCVPSPPALVVIGVGGPIGLVGGVIVGLDGVCPAFGVGAGAVGATAFGAVVCCGAVVVGGAVARGGVAVR